MDFGPSTCLALRLYNRLVWPLAFGCTHIFDPKFRSQHPFWIVEEYIMQSIYKTFQYKLQLKSSENQNYYHMFDVNSIIVFILMMPKSQVHKY